jgi:hypothetical protein
MPFLFAISLFASAALAFLVQPLIGRQLLPLAGGAPAVWTTCLVFFQIMLLAGYLYSHLLARLGHRAAFAIHAILLVVAGTTLIDSTALAPSPTLESWVDLHPVAALTVGLLFAVGLPYFAVATTAPLLQAWFARGGRNPYWLYAASNAGSLLGLLAYPFLFEPLFPLAKQRLYWRLAFAVAGGLIIACGFLSEVAIRRNGQQESTDDSAPVTPGRRLRWLGRSALTTSLLASVTAHLSTDIAPMPLLWVVPLALYLMTYIVTFSHWSGRARNIIGRLAPMAICFTAIALLAQATEPIALVAAVHLAGFATICLLSHGELAADKPSPKHLTDFFLCLALGGVLGGAFNAVLAPLVFSRLGPVEYPLALVLAALVRPGQSVFPVRFLDIFASAIVLSLTLLLSFIVPRVLETPSQTDEAAQLLDRVIRGGLLYGIPIAVTFALVWRPLRFALCLAGVLVVGSLMQARSSHTLEVSRNFFGTLTVSRSADGQFIVLTHGTTRHGQERIGDGKHPEPAMYYHRRGPLGRVFAKPAQRVGVVGLGCGAMAAYAEPGQTWTFFEIDPGVVRLANNDCYFTFLKSCRAGTPNIVLGDARRKLAECPDASFDLLAIDAFSSDAVPVHLLTKEAFELYLRKLAPNGRLLLHVSNRYLDLPSLTGRVVHRIDPSLVVRCDDDIEADHRIGKWASTWVIIARQASDLGKLPMFTTVHPRSGPLWTDDHASLWGVWKRDED